MGPREEGGRRAGEPLEGPQRLRSDRGWTDGGGEEGEENPPTARATRTPGADGGDGGLVGGQRTEDPLGMTKASAENSSAGPRPRQSDGSRSKHGTLARREYDLLSSEATEGVQANAGDVGSEASHGATANRERTEVEEEGDKTPQHVLPA